MTPFTDSLVRIAYAVHLDRLHRAEARAALRAAARRPERAPAARVLPSLRPAWRGRP